MAPWLCFSGGRELWVRGQNLDVVQTPRIRVTVVPRTLQPGQGLGQRHHGVPEKVCSSRALSTWHAHKPPPHLWAALRKLVPEEMLPTSVQPHLSGGASADLPSSPLQFEEPCLVNSSHLIMCRTPALPGPPEDPWVQVEFILDNVVFDFAALSPTPFSYEADPTLRSLNPEDTSAPFRHKPGSVFSVEVRCPPRLAYRRTVCVCWRGQGWKNRP